MQQTKAWYHTVSGLFHAEKCRNPTCERTGFLAKCARLLLGAPKKCKESVFEAQILLQNQANPQNL